MNDHHIPGPGWRPTPGPAGDQARPSPVEAALAQLLHAAVGEGDQ